MINDTEIIHAASREEQATMHVLVYSSPRINAFEKRHLELLNSGLDWQAALRRAYAEVFRFRYE